MQSGNPFRLLSSREIYRNPWIHLRADKVVRPGGREGEFAILDMKPGSTVLAVDQEDQAFLVREYKYAVGRVTTELISGAIEEGESPLEAAERELREEANLEAAEWIELGVIDPFTTLVSSPNYLFLALGLQPGEGSPGEGEIVERVRIPFHRVLEMAMEGEITHAASCVLVLKAARILEARRTLLDNRPTI